ncbi:MAG: TonB-dependent receptor plug domain-containing protein [Burkholderiales bacterium]
MASPIAWAQALLPDLRDAVVVTASRIEQQLTDTIAHTTVITQKDIRESQLADLPSLLRRETGLEFTQNGGVGNVSGIFLRGGDGRQVLVLIDGIRAGSATLGTTQIEGVMLEQIERVEIVRGNVSALYGNGAIGGVVQIFTKQGNGTPRANAQAMIGARGTSSLSAGYRGSVANTRFSLNLTDFQTSGFSAIDPKLAPRANPDKDGYRNSSFSGQIAHRLAEGHEVGLRAYQNYGEVDFDSAFGAASDINRSSNAVSSYSIYSNNRINAIWNSRVTLAQGSDKGRSRTNGATPARTDSTNTQLQWHNEIVLAPMHTLNAGVENQAQRVESSTTYPVTGRDVRSAVLGYNGRLGAHHFQANLRGDHYSDFGKANTWLAGYGFDIDSNWKLTAMRSNAFTAPTFNQLYFPGFGNPNVRPEKSVSNEVGVQYAEGGNLLRLATYRTLYRDLIEAPAPAFTAQNVASARVEGSELSYTGRIAQWDVRAGLTVQDPVNSVTGAPLRRRGNRFGNLVIGTDYAGWRLGSDIVMAGNRADNDIVSGAAVTLGTYKLAHFTARRNLSANSFIAARLDNAFDEKYQLAQGFNVPGRGLFISLGWQQ